MYLKNNIFVSDHIAKYYKFSLSSSIVCEWQLPPIRWSKDQIDLNFSFVKSNWPEFKFGFKLNMRGKLLLTTPFLENRLNFRGCSYERYFQLLFRSSKKNEVFSLFRKYSSTRTWRGTSFNANKFYANMTEILEKKCIFMIMN